MVRGRWPPAATPRGDSRRPYVRGPAASRSSSVLIPSAETDCEERKAVTAVVVRPQSAMQQPQFRGRRSSSPRADARAPPGARPRGAARAQLQASARGAPGGVGGDGLRARVGRRRSSRTSCAAPRPRSPTRGAWRPSTTNAPTTARRRRPTPRRSPRELQAAVREADERDAALAAEARLREAELASERAAGERARTGVRAAEAARARSPTSWRRQSALAAERAEGAALAQREAAARQAAAAAARR